MSARVVVAVGVVALFSARRAEACVCVEPRAAAKNLVTLLHAAEADATNIFYGRVVKIGDNDSPLNATVEVLELFKGKLEPRVIMTYGYGDCSFVPDQLNGRYLIYASGIQASYCGRSRRIEDTDDSELKWLRTHSPFPIPQAVQREQVECTPCSLTAVATRLAGSNPRGTKFGVAAKEVPDELETGHPFWTGGGLNTGDISWTEVLGVAKDGRAFRLVLQPAYVQQERCRRRVTLTYCEALRPAKRTFDLPPFECVKPGEPIAACNENTTRKVKLLPVESMRTVEDCTWATPDAPHCTLYKTQHRFDGGSPVLFCSPEYDWMKSDEDQRGYSCRVKP